MILNIYAYGHPVLRKATQEIKPGDPGIHELIRDMYETMYSASGVGLAAPQVGKSLRLFITDSTPMDGATDDPQPLKDWKKVFINPVILDEEGDDWAYEEGCLSIPDKRADVWRQETIKIRYLDENFAEHTEEFNGMKARIIQHEYDHIKGVLFTDKLSSLKRQLLKSRLTRVTKGLIEPRYPMTFLKVPKISG